MVRGWAGQQGRVRVVWAWAEDSGGFSRVLGTGSGWRGARAEVQSVGNAPDGYAYGEGVGMAARQGVEAWMGWWGARAELQDALAPTPMVWKAGEGGRTGTVGSRRRVWTVHLALS